MSNSQTAVSVATSVQSAAEELALMREMLASLQAENATLKAGAKKGGTRLKVGDKGGLSIYGLGRFPTTLYWSQWQKVFALKAEMEAFYETNKALIEERSEVTRLAKANAVKPEGETAVA